MTVATNALLEGKTARHGPDRDGRLHRRARARPPGAPALCTGCATPRRARSWDPSCASARPSAAVRRGRCARSTRSALRRWSIRSHGRASRLSRSRCFTHTRIPSTSGCSAGCCAGASALALHMSISSELVGTFREYERTATTVLDAALSPARRFLPAPARIRVPRTGPSAARDHAVLGRPRLDRPGGGARRGDGPLGSCRGSRRGAFDGELAGAENVLCFDMGGTSCDVCLIDRSQVAETAAARGHGPPARAAGTRHPDGRGGRRLDRLAGPGGALRVGPQSAGALPGPACYGRGGDRPTVTDANLLLGRLREDTPLAGHLRLDRGAAERSVSGLARELGTRHGACAAGIVRVAEAEMLSALRVLTVERGIDPRHSR